jgi:hypothetical protein
LIVQNSTKRTKKPPKGNKMPQPDRDTANYTLFFASQGSEGLPTPLFLQNFFRACLTATEEELDQLSIGLPEYVAAYRLSTTEDGTDILRQLAHPDPT